MNTIVLKAQKQGWTLTDTMNWGKNGRCYTFERNGATLKINGKKDDRSIKCSEQLQAEGNKVITSKQNGAVWYFVGRKCNYLDVRFEDKEICNIIEQN